MALSEIKDTTGSKLNQYKITHADGTTEVVTLEFSRGRTLCRARRIMLLRSIRGA